MLRVTHQREMHVLGLGCVGHRHSSGQTTHRRKMLGFYPGFVLTLSVVPYVGSALDLVHGLAHQQDMLCLDLVYAPTFHLGTNLVFIVSRCEIHQTDQS